MKVPYTINQFRGTLSWRLDTRNLTFLQSCRAWASLRASESRDTQLASKPHTKLLPSLTLSRKRVNSQRRQHFNLVHAGCASPQLKMRTYDDSFSGQKIYPGKVRFRRRLPSSPEHHRTETEEEPFDVHI